MCHLQTSNGICSEMNEALLVPITSRTALSVCGTFYMSVRLVCVCTHVPYSSHFAPGVVKDDQAQSFIIIRRRQQHFRPSYHLFNPYS